MVFQQAGTQTLTATDVDNAFVTGTGSTTVLGGEPRRIYLAQVPTTVVAGSTDVQVMLRDQYGNLASSGYVGFASSDPRAATVLSPRLGAATIHLP